ncbi:nicotinamidase/pyrazinamidase [Octadecabacter temperatus]|uniref:Nicotinamidase n=1 Tax=Octadecabacter temperatus TaxID=1458307 RepID=A0A0K0Y2M7_9RHOB|nr:bifunctional nicotinamidase/pyrazinamidase [Octadecabacter temperatus]AKS45156.1 nicotinamidase/pyrazinamidase [Octadecabacter temperatus]SIN87296.1 nicotinamidase/pyrazinamidase [Octadecabacter temperatus]
MTEALIVIDIQNDFCPGGALAVPNGDQVVVPTNALIEEAKIVILSQDWHPADHSSFASNHTGKVPFDVVEMEYGSQTLWPAHCVQGSSGAAFHPKLKADLADAVFRKGMRPAIDSYSTFFENDRKTPTGLVGFLRERNVTDVRLVGLALDFCVAFSALDAVEQGFEVTVQLDACRAIDIAGSRDAALEQMRDCGVRLV